MDLGLSCLGDPSLENRGSRMVSKQGDGDWSGGWTRCGDCLARQGGLDRTEQEAWEFLPLIALDPLTAEPVAGRDGEG